jgi:UDP-glucose:glycoprotein glucosyltransferase
VDSTIHIFVVSSGLLYERLQRIMILSLVRHASAPVHLWILANFVSPQHRRLLPKLATRLGFTFSFVSYSWPSWMPRETARERLIWSYKILFLDVMFPNHLSRVIYVDSDDVIRADYAELMRMNIDSALYAFTPFCEDRPEMEEFRFWNDGYWRNLLNGRKYHISALFIVDLVQLKKQEIGDFIRKAYMDLHSDKLSLWNLDQDIPNLLQDKGARIFSLPQEWLWCGSWCSDATMSTAKTIDMCNNPKTKVGKLEYARSNIPEWEELDHEVNGVVDREEL